MADGTQSYTLEGHTYTVPSGTTLDELDEYIKGQGTDEITKKTQATAKAAGVSTESKPPVELKQRALVTGRELPYESSKQREQWESMQEAERPSSEAIERGTSAVGIAAPLVAAPVGGAPLIGSTLGRVGMSAGAGILGGEIGRAGGRVLFPKDQMAEDIGGYAGATIGGLLGFREPPARVGFRGFGLDVPDFFRPRGAALDAQEGLGAFMNRGYKGVPSGTGAPLPSTGEFYENEGAERDAIRRMNETLDLRRSLAAGREGRAALKPSAEDILSEELSKEFLTPPPASGVPQRIPLPTTPVPTYVPEGVPGSTVRIPTDPPSWPPNTSTSLPGSAPRSATVPRTPVEGYSGASTGPKAEIIVKGTTQGTPGGPGGSQGPIYKSRLGRTWSAGDLAQMPREQLAGEYAKEIAKPAAEQDKEWLQALQAESMRNTAGMYPGAAAVTKGGGILK